MALCLVYITVNVVNDVNDVNDNVNDEDIRLFHRVCVAQWIGRVGLNVMGLSHGPGLKISAIG